MSLNHLSLAPLDESQRLAYLQAMDVPVWVLRETENVVEQNVTNVAQVTIEVDSESAAHESIDKQEEIADNTTNIESNVLQTSAIEIDNGHAPDDDAVDERQPAQDAWLNNAIDEVAAQGLSHFLKMVPWSRGTKEDPAILIVCRHQTDQPAQSFARANAPSQFMSDFIQALSEFLNHKPTDYQIRLGHLAQAGLGQDCIELSQVMLQIRPQIVLILGDETVKELFGGGNDVAQLRGKVLKLAGDFPCLVSYHPYTLIKNPALKRLAMADLQLCASFL